MKFIKPNWHLINKAIEAGDLKDLRQEESDLKKKIQSKVDAYYKAKREKEVADKIAALKNLPLGGTIHYIGRSADIAFGAQGTKVKDGRTRMIVDINGKHWSCYYSNLKTDEPTQGEKSSHIVTTRIGELLNEKF